KRGRGGRMLVREELKDGRGLLQPCPVVVVLDRPGEQPPPLAMIRFPVLAPDEVLPTDQRMTREGAGVKIRKRVPRVRQVSRQVERRRLGNDPVDQPV